MSQVFNSPQDSRLSDFSSAAQYAAKETKASADPIEDEIQAKGLTAPRITPADIEANIKSEHYFRGSEGHIGSIEADGRPVGFVPIELSLLTFCVLILRNGFTVTGESACASPENFDAEIGKKIARQNAINKVWPLMGYELRSKLSIQGECTCGPKEGCSNCPKDNANG